MYESFTLGPAALNCGPRVRAMEI